MVSILQTHCSISCAAFPVYKYKGVKGEDIILHLVL